MAGEESSAEIDTDIESFIPKSIDDIQEVLLEIWSELLPAANNIQLDLNFKSLGGDSVFVMNLLSRIWDAFEIELGPGILFDLNTIEALSRHIAGRLSIPAE